MTSSTIVITGASDGIGAAAARQLASNGHTVVLVGRSPDKTAALAEELSAPYHLADFSRLDQVHQLAAELDAAYSRIDVLANNAGGIMGPRTVTADGFELTFQVNHLAGFLLTNLLMPKLAASAASVVQTSSVAARVFSRLDLDDLNAARSYSAQSAYGSAKLANILFTRELHHRFHDQGIAAAAFHPGVVGSNFAHDASGFMQVLYSMPLAKRLMLSPAQGADQLVWLAEGTAGTDWESGKYYERRRVARSAPMADDAEVAARLWEASAEMVGV